MLRPLFLLIFLFLCLCSAKAQRTITAPQSVSETRVDRTRFEYVMTASLTNSAPTLAKATVATVTSTSPKTTIVEGTLIFGNVAPGATAASTDTFTIRHDRTVPFDPAVLVWTITAAPNDPTVAALNAAGQRSAIVPLAVMQDQQPPALFLDFPQAGDQFTTDTVVVGGRVGDMLSGYQGLTVTVNGQPAAVNVGIGNNGTFMRAAVPLALGPNTLTATATDINGNSVTVPIAPQTITVTRVVPTGPQMLALSGDMQTAPMHARLPQPLVVKIVNGDGTPFAGKIVTFTVTRSDGRLVADAAQITPGALFLQMPTDAQGLARAWWHVGADAGQANNRVSVVSKDIAGTVGFCASATAGPVHQINIGTGHNQKAEAGSPAPEPLRAWVSDMCNGIANLPITFTVRQGGGKVNGQDSATVATGITGHAQVSLTLGPDAGSNVVEANYAGNPNLPATFLAYGVSRDLSKPTTFTGLVLDNTSNPIGGATCKLVVAGQTFTTTSDPQGRFAFSSTSVPSVPALPSGSAHLYVDGLTATALNGAAVPAGTFPPLGYLTTVIPNAENSLPTPVLLPCMNVHNARTYDGTTGLVLTCEGIAGLKMTIKAGSMHKPDGTLVTPSNPAVVSLNQVHHDQIPMPMPDGASPPFAWTLQPGGAHFDPPVALEYPNMSGLPAGAIAYFLSFNHDTERFEIVASGHVTPDGSTILSDPGAGLSLAGWGCNCPPYSVTGKGDKCGDNGLGNLVGRPVPPFVDMRIRTHIPRNEMERRLCGLTEAPLVVKRLCDCDPTNGGLRTFFRVELSGGVTDKWIAYQITNLAAC